MFQHILRENILRLLSEEPLTEKRRPQRSQLWKPDLSGQDCKLKQRPPLNWFFTGKTGGVLNNPAELLSSSKTHENLHFVQVTSRFWREKMVNKKHHSVFGMAVFPGFKLSNHAFFPEFPHPPKNVIFVCKQKQTPKTPHPSTEEHHLCFLIHRKTSSLFASNNERQ